MAIPTNKRMVQSELGSGHFGDTFEAELHTFFSQLGLVGRGRAIDLILDRVFYEVKTGAGELGRIGNKPCGRVSMVIYCPVYNQDLPLKAQEAFVLTRKAFLDSVVNSGLFRDCKTPTNGRTSVMAIQTFWNRSKNAPHGKKYFVLLDQLYQNMTSTLEDFLTAWEAKS